MPTPLLRSGREYLVSPVPYWNSHDPKDPTPPEPTRATLLGRQRWTLRKAKSTHTQRLVHHRLGTFDVPGHLTTSGNHLAMHTASGKTILVPPAWIRGEWSNAYEEWCEARAAHSEATYSNAQLLAERGAQALRAARNLMKFGVNAAPNALHGTVTMTSTEAERLTDLLNRLMTR